MARYLVTGGCGFIGSHTADALLSAGHEVRILDDLSSGKLENRPPAAHLAIGDVADIATVKQAAKDVDGIFHFAAIASVERCNRDWLGAHHTNLTGTITIFEAARSANPQGPVPVIYASSAAVYGRSRELPLNESARTRPASPYGADKLGCELHAAAEHQIYGLPSCGLRFFNVYGPRQNPRSPYSGVISIFCDRARRGEPITIFGDGRQTRDFVHVDDVVRAVVGAMQRCRGDAEVLNICTGKGTSLLELVALLERSVKFPEVSFAEKRPGDIESSVGDPSSAARKLSFSARMEIGAGLVRLLDHGPGRERRVA